MKITSLQNPKVKYAVRLRNRSFRDKEQKTLLEGYRALRRACDTGFPIDECFYCPEMFLGSNENTLLEELAAKNVISYCLTPEVFAKLAYRERPEGLIAVAGCPRHSLNDIGFVENGLYVVAESIEKPGNLGAILRSSDGAGADAIILCDKKTDLYNPNVITASTGTIFTMPIAESSPDEVYSWLKKNNVKLIAATPHTDKVYTDIDMTGPVALLLGAEQFGLSEFWLGKSDFPVKIPMAGLADSLNVGIAAAILLFEAARQRGWKKEHRTFNIEHPRFSKSGLSIE